MALNKLEVSIIKALMRADAWDVLVKFCGQKIGEWNAMEVTGSNEFETLRALHLRQGKVDGLKEFFDQMERQAFD